jgi:hypothetical protein
MVIVMVRDYAFGVIFSEGQRMKQLNKLIKVCASACAALFTVSCGGGGGSNNADSGANKTYLSVDATDANGQALTYQWRVTGGQIDNRNARETVWTLPDGPGMHFAYVSVSDGQGGYTEQQYAVSSDALDTPAPSRPAVQHTATPMAETAGSPLRITLLSPDDTLYTPPGGGTALRRDVYLPDVQVELTASGASAPAFTGLSDLLGVVNVPKLAAGNYNVRCKTSQVAQLSACGAVTVDANDANAVRLNPTVPATRNLRLYGHVALVDGGLCGYQNEFFGIQSTATVQLQQANGLALTPALRVNRFGDYALDAAVDLQAPLKLHVQCESFSQTLNVPAPAAAAYTSAGPLELSFVVPNARPSIRKMVATGPDGNVRGKMLVPELDVSSNALPGADQFLTYKGADTRLSSCMYYRSFGAVRGCDAQGNMQEPIAFEDWKRQHQFAPYGPSSRQISATYVNKMDLNLVRRMVATESGPNHAAFYVCNYPGPTGQTQREVDQVIEVALNNQKQIACVAMDWSITPGVNNDQPFTKFLTFGPNGALLHSINLDGRGEKYMPGACVACHGGTQYNAKFAEKGQQSAHLNANFLAFDSNNYLYSSANGLTEAAQVDAVFRLNQRVVKTNPPAATKNLIQGWYAAGSTTPNKAYTPSVWHQAGVTTPGADAFYREVVGTSCRTCHAAMRDRFDWDTAAADGTPKLLSFKNSTKVCGGGADLATNASMPNALVSHDRLLAQARSNPNVAQLMRTFLGCDAPAADPVYGKR